ncbi:uncharacterized protein LOC123532182 isoform X2 [Mercenaria mercenaria]|uniref:uncharacterized protein LOC123532182 isoform X2 n=1 Tax=Mercenaria mercenaria TaxID=6596 RepID=UPI00234F8C08|nr:uncharacterized protein LOC123532182 isoform X2 [Mercenaria mercenaria]
MELFVIIKMLLVSLYICFLSNGPIAFAFRRKEEPENVVKYLICKEPWCEKYSPSEVAEMFPGVFLTKEKYLIQKSIYNETRANYLRNEGVKDVDIILGLGGDGDSCCATTYKAHINSSLTNIDGIKRSIVHMTSVEPPMYQFIPHAYCETTTSGGCFGICVLEKITLTLLVYDPVAKIMIFDQFLLPGYCSCKRVLQ